METAQGKHAFITGGASGIGLGIADALLRRGAKVTIVDNHRDALSAVTAERNGKLFAETADVRDRATLAAAKAAAEKARGPIDILVANAGIGPDFVDIADTKPDAFERLMAINVGGIFNAVSVFADGMRKRRGGDFLITGSVAGLVTGQVPGIGPYCASKFAVMALGEALRAEMAAYDVNVSLLVPGMVKTNLGKTTKRLSGEPAPIMRAGGAPASMSAMDPTKAGEIAVAGLLQNRAFIVTHPEEWPQIDGRWNALKEAFEAPA